MNDLIAAAKELDRWALVIESAVREDQRHHLEAIVDALLANRAAIAKAEGLCAGTVQSAPIGFHGEVK